MVLKHDLLSISQLCDKGFRVVFDKNNCMIENASDRKVLLVGNEDDNMYTNCPINVFQFCLITLDYGIED